MDSLILCKFLQEFDDYLLSVRYVDLITDWNMQAQDLVIPRNHQCKETVQYSRWLDALKTPCLNMLANIR